MDSNCSIGRTCTVHGTDSYLEVILVPLQAGIKKLMARGGFAWALMEWGPRNYFVIFDMSMIEEVRGEGAEGFEDMSHWAWARNEMHVEMQAMKNMPGINHTYSSSTNA